MLVAGLTGNYGMGKSTVLRIFGRLGAVTVSADGIVSELLRETSVLEKIRKVFGKSVFTADDNLDRAKTASIIFAEKKKKDALEDILHPLVFEKIEELLKELERKDSGCIVIIEIPLLFEKRLSGRFKKTIAVYTDEETALRRLEERGVSREDAKMRLVAQMPIKEKMGMADFSIDNRGSPEETEKQVKAIYDRLIAEAGNGYHKRA